MCGRMVAATTTDVLDDYFEVDQIELSAQSYEPNYNVAPTQQILVIAEHQGLRRLGTMQWGLIPRFAQDASGGARMINARAESVAAKPAYREAFLRRRCLIPADGFYEWETLPGTTAKQPWYFEGVTSEPLAFAGLWDVWRNPGRPEAPPLVSCTIITTEANNDVPIHERMPVMLGADSWTAWLDRTNTDSSKLQQLVHQATPVRLTRRRVSDNVNSVANNSPDLLDTAGVGLFAVRSEPID